MGSSGIGGGMSSAGLNLTTPQAASITALGGGGPGAGYGPGGVGGGVPIGGDQVGEFGAPAVGGFQGGTLVSSGGNAIGGGAEAAGLGGSVGGIGGGTIPGNGIDGSGATGLNLPSGLGLPIGGLPPTVSGPQWGQSPVGALQGNGPQFGQSPSGALPGGNTTPSWHPGQPGSGPGIPNPGPGPKLPFDPGAGGGNNPGNPGGGGSKPLPWTPPPVPPGNGPPPPQSPPPVVPPGAGPTPNPVPAQPAPPGPSTPPPPPGRPSVGPTGPGSSPITPFGSSTSSLPQAPSPSGPGPGGAPSVPGGGPEANPSAGLNQAGNWWNDFANFQNSRMNPNAPIGQGAVTPGSQQPFMLGAAPAGPQLGAAAPQMRNPRIGFGRTLGNPRAQGLMGLLG